MDRQDDMRLRLKAARANREAEQAQRRLERRREREEKRIYDAQAGKNDPLLIRVINDWWARLIDFAYGGKAAAATEQYEAHMTVRDYVWNSAGLAAWSFMFPVLTVVATQLSGLEAAGRLSMAFVVGNLLLILANYGARTYQVSDVYEENSFSDYQVQRVLTVIAMLLVGLAWCRVRGYDAEMTQICFGVFAFRAVDGLADVYEGRLQQTDKLYLAGISQMLRSVAGIAVFCIVLFVTRMLPFASIGLALGGIASFVLLTLPLTLLETPRSERWNLRRIRSITFEVFPVFAALFLYALIDSMPKFAMEGALSYDNQLYFNAMYFPAHAILTVANVIYKPQLVRLATLWKDPNGRRKFSVLVIAMLAVIGLITLVMGLFMQWFGIKMLSFMYGTDFEQFHLLVILMVITGGICGGIEFLYQIITVLRRQRQVTRIYLIAALASIPVCFLLVRFIGLPGAVWANLGIMAALFVALVVQYISMRREKPVEEDALFV